MPTYETAWFAPPAPLARVTLRHPDTGAAVLDVPRLIDTGAEVTLIPQASVARLGVIPIADHHYELMGFDGSVSLAPVVPVELVFLRRTFRGQFLVIEQEWGILGRNILNALSLLLDGPRLTWEER